MPFEPRQERREQPAPQRPEAPRYETPLTRWGGLYVSRSGKAIAGNINLTRIDQQSGMPFGQVIISQVEECLKTGRPLRIVIFENSGSDYERRAPYTISSTYGMSKQVPAEPDDQPQGASWDGNVPTGTSEVPRPTRRGAPRR